jgi:flagellar secretion chaperone FliS
MYAPASPFNRPILAGARALSGVYRQVGVETSVSGGSPYDLVKLLFEGYFDAIAQARGAMQNKDIELKARAVSRAVRIIDEGLKASLDLQQGGELAARLDQLYAYVSIRLTQANLRNDLSALEECAQLITPIREAWESIPGDVRGFGQMKKVVA